EDSLMARLDHLGPAKDVAQVAAVIGREFSYALLQAVIPLPEHELQAALDGPAGARRFYKRGVTSEATVVFHDAPSRDAAYAALRRSRGRGLHRAIATTLQDRFPDTVAAQPELLARHHTEAGDAEPAVAAWQQAAQLALARLAYPEAIADLQRGL